MTTTALAPRRIGLRVLDDSERESLAPRARGDVTSLTPGERAARASFRVALVSMPFQSALTPSIQLGLLSAIGESHGFPVETFHLNLELARRVEFSLYEELCQMRGRLMGDWLFSVDAFRDAAPDRAARFLDEFSSDVAGQLGEEVEGKVETTEALRHRLTSLRIRDEVVPAFLNAMMAEIDWSSFAVVGFSSVFQQTVASLALARRIKEAHPHVKIVFGGSNFDGEMGLELVRRIDWIDHAVIGEGDVALPELLIALAEGKATTSIRGVASRGAAGVTFAGSRKLLEDLDQLPTPRYEEYFRRAEATGFMKPSKRRTTRLPFESARGCWWGEKHHCTFCGLNNNGMKFRSKSPERVADEMAELSRKYRSFVLTSVDNIVENDYMKTLFPRLVGEQRDYNMFYEVKSNLTREQIKGMRLAGITEIQPGIESLSSNVLRLMRKGVTAAQNVNTLRWATYYGVHVGWNVIWGFPGETAEDYAEQAKLVPNLTHLNPPIGSGGRIWMERFSPLFTDQNAFPLEHRRAEESYGYVYPANIDLEKIAYFFQYKLKGSLDESVYVDLKAGLKAWMNAWKDVGSKGGQKDASDDGAAAAAPSAHRPWLHYYYSEDFLQISDGRRAEKKSFTFEGPLARMYKAAVERPVRVQKVIEDAKLDVSAASVVRALDELCERGVMMRDGDKFLALALPATPGR